MRVRRAFFHWLVPAAFVLPLWLLIGWISFDAGGWALLMVLLIAMPAVFLGQLVVTLLVRARGTVRHSRAVSWWDMLGFGVWHALTIAAGFYPEGGFWGLVALATVAFLVLFWVSLWQLFREARPGARMERAADGTLFIPAAERPTSQRTDPQVIIINETDRPTAP